MSSRNLLLPVKIVFEKCLQTAKTRPRHFPLSLFRHVIARSTNESQRINCVCGTAVQRISEKTHKKPLKALLLDILCIVMQLYGHAQRKLEKYPKWEIDSVKVMMRIILWGMWNRADLTKALSFYSSHAHAMLDAWINCQLIHSKYFHRWFMIINRDHS